MKKPEHRPTRIQSNPGQLMGDRLLRYVLFLGQGEGVFPDVPFVPQCADLRICVQVD